MFNIQLNYNINQALDPESWDSEFRAVSLHEFMEHLASNIKNIKESLQRMGKYIKAKSVNANPNNIKDLDSIGKEISLWYMIHTGMAFKWMTPRYHSEIK